MFTNELYSYITSLVIDYLNISDRKTEAGRTEA